MKLFSININGLIYVQSSCILTRCTVNTEILKTRTFALVSANL